MGGSLIIYEIGMGMGFWKAIVKEMRYSNDFSLNCFSYFVF